MIFIVKYAKYFYNNEKTFLIFCFY